MDALSDNLFRQYQDIATLKELWDQLKTDHETTDVQMQLVVRPPVLEPILNDSGWFPGLLCNCCLISIG